MWPKQPNEVDLFLDACFSDDVQAFYRECIQRRYLLPDDFTGLVQGTSKNDKNWRIGTKPLYHKRWKIGRTCAVSGRPLTRETADLYVTRPKAYWLPIHKEYKAQPGDYPQLTYN